MTKPPAISCIVPAYNADQYLAQALNSLLAQVGVSFEMIVVDDGSTDGTADVVASFGSAVRSLRQENAGHPAARNLGVAASQGELVTFMDADDISAAGRFALQAEAFDRDPELGLCAGMVQRFTGDRVFSGEPIGGFSTEVMVRRQVFEQVGGFNASLHHATQLDWMLRARKAGTKEVLLPNVLLYRRLHEQNMSWNSAEQSLREHLRVLHATIRKQA